jgi:hypothetical protein
VAVHAVFGKERSGNPLQAVVRRTGGHRQDSQEQQRT